MYESRRNLLACFLTLVFWAVFAVWFKSFEIELSWQRAGWINFSLGFVLLVAYLSSQIVKIGRLPLISGYIIAGIIAGPSVSNFLTDEMLNRLRLIDDVALSTIALAAGGALHLQILKQRIKPIILNIVLITLIVFGLVFMFVVATGNHFTFTRQLSSAQVITLAIFVGIIAVARSPSSAIAIITECRASGPFTETVLSITVAMDVLIIILFTAALSVTQNIFNSGGMAENPVIVALTLEVAMSLLIGAVLGNGFSF